MVATTEGRDIEHSHLRGLSAVLTVAGLAVALPACVGAASAAPRVYHFADCQTGAAPDCVSGSNRNPGTEKAPKQDLAGIDIGSLPPGSRLLFQRGGAWKISHLRVENDDASPTHPIVFDAYGSGSAQPLWRVASGVGVQVGGNWGNTNNDGGYTFRNLRLQGHGSDNSHWGFWLVQNVHHVTIENVEITGFKLGIHASAGKPYGVSALTVRNSVISRNADMGHLGALTNSVYEGNLFEANNFSGSGMNHAIYLGGGSGNVIRNNRFIRNSVVGGECKGGNVTVHGMIDGLLIEDNLIEQDAGAPGCFGFSITQGYDYAEAFRNVVVRNNTVVNTGNCAICVNSAPGIVIEGNRSINITGRFHTLAWTFGQNDTPMTEPVVRNNTLCVSQLNGAVSNLPGAKTADNQVRTGGDAKTGVCAR